MNLLQLLKLYRKDWALKKVIELFYAPTLQMEKKFQLCLEEIGFDTKYKINPEGKFSKGEQFKPEFRKISPFSKIPAITDHEE